MFAGTAQVFDQVCHFFVSSVCLLVRVTMVDKNKTRLLFASHIGHNVIQKEGKKKRKMWRKKRYLKRNISCDAHLLNELLETDAP
jgi:SUMO ligase MMS21 Smc5/6 complex component